MNSDFVARLANSLAKRLQSGDDAVDIRNAYPLLYGREASKAEVELGRQFLESKGASGWPEYAQALMSSNEFIFVN